MCVLGALARFAESMAASQIYGAPAAAAAACPKWPASERESEGARGFRALDSNPPSMIPTRKWAGRGKTC